MKQPLLNAVAQSDVDMAGFDLKNAGIPLREPALYLGSCMITGERAVGGSGTNPDPRVRLIASADGLQWNLLTGAIFDEVLADPTIIFYAGFWWISATSNSNQYPTILKSANLRTWEKLPQEDCPDTSPFMVSTEYGSLWAPEWFQDNDGTLHLYLSLSPANRGTDGIVEFRIYETHPLNDELTEWSTPVEVFAISDGLKCPIDAYVFREGDTYHLWYAMKDAGGSISYIEFAEGPSPTGPFTRTRTGDWLGTGSGVEAPGRIRFSDTHWRLYCDRYSNVGMLYSDTFDAGATWSAAAELDHSLVTGNPDIGFSHPTFVAVETMAQALAVFGLMAGSFNTRYLRPFVRAFDDALTIIPTWGDEFSKRVSINFDNAWYIGRGLRATGLNDFMIQKLGLAFDPFNISVDGLASFYYGLDVSARPLFIVNLTPEETSTITFKTDAREWAMGATGSDHATTPDVFYLFGGGANRVLITPEGQVNMGMLRVEGVTPTPDANCGTFDFLAGYTRLISFGGNPSTKGGFAFIIESSDASQIATPMGIYPSGGVVVGTMSDPGANNLAVQGRLKVAGLPVYADNAAAVAGGLTAGAFYRTGADPDPVCVVH